MCDHLDPISKQNFDEDYMATLRIDCGECSGLCCVALYCTKTDGFPENKKAGIPCKHLLPDFRCDMHAALAGKNMKGCLAYDCFGAGQKVTKICYPKENWKKNPEKAEEIFRVFLAVYQLHQMAWFLVEALNLSEEQEQRAEIKELVLLNQKMTSLPPEEILGLEIETYKARVNPVLKQMVANASHHGTDYSMKTMIGANLRSLNLIRGIFLGTDLRGANVKDIDLSSCIFLTQMQINSAAGNSGTKLPASLSRPAHWKEE